MVSAIDDGKLKALYVIGEDLITADANYNRVDES